MALKPKSWLKIEQIARMRVYGISNTKICQLLGYSMGGLARLITLPEYLDTEKSILLGVTGQMDTALAGRSDEMKRTFAVGVPLAMRTLLEICGQRRDLRSANSAAQEILDRDPENTFSKKRETGISPFQTVPDGILNNATAEGDLAAARMVPSASDKKVN